jgi:hypothetical protein
MVRSRAEKIVNLLTAVLVLLAGFYVIIFLPIGFSGMTRILLGVLILVYFSWRVRSTLKGSDEKETEGRKSPLRDD